MSLLMLLLLLIDEWSILVSSMPLFIDVIIVGDDVAE